MYTIGEIAKMTDFSEHTLDQRLLYYQEYRKKLEIMLASLESNLDKIDWKIDYYQKAVETGTEKIHENSPDLYDLYFKKETDG
ncbi:hypothetical protein [Enterococcus sp. AZ126]|uniref:hypothetical protein n=1 Tax=Enterococcus sp. AZ126 TaxID=2774635 RepID=UPI003F21E58C